MPEYIIRWDGIYRAWVLFEAPDSNALFQQVAMNHELIKDQREGAEAWANGLVKSWGYETSVTVKES
jgi:hypothetical protein